MVSPSKATSNESSEMPPQPNTDNSPPKEDPWKVPVQVLSIKMLDPARIERDYRVANGLKKENPLPGLADLTEFVVNKYNRENPLSSGEAPFKKLNFPQDTWNKVETKNFSITAFYSFIAIPNSI